MIQILNKRSSTHPNWCEDNYWVKETDKIIIGAVLDGCSTGINSHWASLSIKYLLEKASKDEIKYGHPNDLCTRIIVDIWLNLISLQKLMDISEMNILSTIVFFHYNKEKNELFVKFFGDGVIYVNGNEIINDENNTPDYLAYYCNDCKYSVDIFEWINNRRSEFYENVTDFSICSDGIHSLVNLKNPHIKKEVAINFLIIDEQWKRLENGLNKKFNILTNRDEDLKRSNELYWWDIKDDLTIIKFNSNATI